MKTVFTTFFLLFCLIPALAAQTQTGSSSEKEKRGSVFRSTSLGKWMGPELFIRNGKKWEPVEMLDMGLSPAMRFSRSEPIVFARQVQVEDELKYLPVVTVKIPANCLIPLVLMQAQEDGKIQQFITDLDPKNYPYGSYKLVNFTKDTVTAQFGKKRFSLRSGGVELVDPRKDAENRLPIMIVKNHGKENAEILYSNMVMNRPAKRMVMILHPAKGRNGETIARVRSLVDFRQ